MLLLSGEGCADGETRFAAEEGHLPAEDGKDEVGGAADLLPGRDVDGLPLHAVQAVAPSRWRAGQEAADQQRPPLCAPVNCGDREGFLEGTKVVFDSKSTDGRDYHSEMNGQIFEQWVEEQLVPSLPPESVIVMDNASYHSVQVCLLISSDQMRKWNSRNPFYRETVIIMSCAVGNVCEGKEGEGHFEF